MQNKWSSIYDQEDRLYLDWDIHYQCNFDCSYCFQKFYGNYGKKIDNVPAKIKYLMSLLKNHKLDFTLGLLGGEPTLHPKEYFQILDYFDSEILTRKPVSEIYVSTNMSKDVDFYRYHPVYRNVYQWVSIHPEHHLNDIHFFEKLTLLLHASPDQFILGPMLYNIDDEVMVFYEKVYQFFLDHKDTHNIIYSPQIIFSNSDFIENNCLDFDTTNPIFNNSITEFTLDDENITLNEFMENPTSFKGASCNYNYYYISPDLRCTGSCTNTSFNIQENPIKFLYLKPERIVCQSSQCLDYPMMLSDKER